MKRGLKSDSDKTVATVENEARHRISWQMANNLAVELGLQGVFLDSREWPGYQKAFISWQRALWKWADAGVHKRKSRWRQYLLENRDLFPPRQDVTAPVSGFDLECGFQTYLLQRAVFLGPGANRKKSDPAWWKRFAFFLHLAERLNDDVVFNRVTELTRRSGEATGKRALSDWLRLYWFPGCFWAFTNKGISELIARVSNKGDWFNYKYNSIKNTITPLNLWRPVSPLHRGLNTKNKIIPLR